MGQPGRRALRHGLEQVARSHAIDCAVVNVENAAGGSGLTEQLYKKFQNMGANLMTLGDHVYRRKEIIPILEKSDCAVRPANLPKDAPGREFAVYRTRSGHGVAVISILGRLYMKQPLDCPFRTVDRVLGLLPPDVKVVVVDVHAEATSEKIAMGWHLDGRASIVFGTHTHIPTADERVLPRGTAYITDLGMTGPYDSVLGRCTDRVLSAMISGVPISFDVATRDARMSGVIAEVDPRSGKAVSIERVHIAAGDES